MILGAPDVVPHQDLTNPVFDPPDNDPDQFAYGDLPYACDARTRMTRHVSRGRPAWWAPFPICQRGTDASHVSH
jgi:hypothetical protein